MPFFGPLSFLGVSSVVVAAALLLLGGALAGARRGIELRCRRCGHEIPRTSELPARCSECGADLAKPNALVAGRWRVRYGMLALALGLLAVVPLLPVAGRFFAQATTALGGGDGIDSVISKAAAGDTGASMRLSDMLGAAASKSTDDAWRDATRRFAQEPATRAAILGAVVGIGDGMRVGGGTGLGMGPGAGPTGIHASEESLRAFGEELAKALASDRALRANLPRTTAFTGALPFDIAEPVLASAGAKQAFLRGPKLRLRSEGPRNAGQGMQRVRLVREGFGIFGRELAFGEAATLYRRKDGSEHALRTPFGTPELDATFGTMIDFGMARRDPEWNGEIVVRATVGTAASARRGGGRRSAFDVDDPFEFVWTIVVDTGAPAAGRRVALNGTILTSWVADQLRTLDLRIEGEGDAATLFLELVQLGTINGVQAGVRAEVTQGGRSWSEPEDFDAHGQGERPALPAQGFDGTKPFEVRLRGVPPGESVPGDCAYIAGTWTLAFDRAGRPPRSVSYTAAVDAQPLDQAPEDLKPSRGGGEEIE